MELLALPFQKQYHTYLPKSPIYGNISVTDLPIAFFNLINRQNGGYTSINYVPTQNPTPDALNAVNISYIAGLFDRRDTPDYFIPSLLYQDQFICRDALTVNDLIFFEDQKRCAYFHYDTNHSSQHPSIWYYDHRTKHQECLAESFATLLEKFEARYFPIQSLPKHSYHIGNRVFLKDETGALQREIWDYAKSLDTPEWESLWLNQYKA